MKTLIFEDNYIAALSLRMIMEELGGEVLGTYDIADNLVSIMEKDKADVIFMDIILNSDKTGIEAIEELRRHSNEPVIFLSANNSKETIDRIQDIENSTFVGKPYSEAEVIKKLKEIGLLSE